MNDASQQPQGSTPIVPVEELVLEQVVRDAKSRWKEFLSTNGYVNRQKVNRDYYTSVGVAGRLQKFVNDVAKDELFGGNVLFRNARLRAKNATAIFPEITVSTGDDAADAAIKSCLEKVLNTPSAKKSLNNGLLAEMLDFISVQKILPANGSISRQQIRFQDLFMEPSCVFDTAVPTGLSSPVIGHTVRGQQYGKLIQEYPRLIEVAKANTKEGTVPTIIDYDEVMLYGYSPDGTQYDLVVRLYDGRIFHVEENPLSGMPISRPFVFYVYDATGEFGPMADTTVFEQGVPLQKIIYRRIRQISAIADAVIPFAVVGQDMEPDQVAALKRKDYNQVLKVDSPVSDHVQFVQAPGPTAAMFEEVMFLISQADALFSTNPISRGEAVGDLSGISRQIAKEADMSVADDIQEVCLNRAITEIANLTVQYWQASPELAPEECRSYLGTLPVIEVKTLSTSDRDRRTQALNLLQMGMIDPVSAYKDMEVPEPVKRAALLMTWLAKDTDMGQSYIDQAGIPIQANPPAVAPMDQAMAQLGGEAQQESAGIPGTSEPSTGSPGSSSIGFGN